jgi:hypothetical protein
VDASDSRVAICTVAILVVTLSSCAKHGPRSAELLSFETPEAAADALIAVLEQDDREGLRKLLGAEKNVLVSSGDDVADRHARNAFVVRFKSAHQWVAGGPDDLVLLAGEDGWPLPIPLIRREGRWYFDGAAGGTALISRRLGDNEPRVIDAMRGFVAAQEEKANEPHSSVGPLTFVVNKEGVAWQKDPGSETSKLADEVRKFAPEEGPVP